LNTSKLTNIRSPPHRMVEQQRDLPFGTPTSNTSSHGCIWRMPSDRVPSVKCYRSDGRPGPPVEPRLVLQDRGHHIGDEVGLWLKPRCRVRPNGRWLFSTGCPSPPHMIIPTTEFMGWGNPPDFTENKHQANSHRPTPRVRDPVIAAWTDLVYCCDLVPAAQNSGNLSARWKVQSKVGEQHSALARLLRLGHTADGC
jgi:hypothetical protein